jgi:hypothetical protein
MLFVKRDLTYKRVVSKVDKTAASLTNK